LDSDNYNDKLTEDVLNANASPYTSENIHRKINPDLDACNCLQCSSFRQSLRLRHKDVSVVGTARLLAYDPNQTESYEGPLIPLYGYDNDDESWACELELLREQNFINNNIEDGETSGEEEELRSVRQAYEDSYYMEVFNGLDNFIEKWREKLRSYSCIDALFSTLSGGFIWTFKKLVELIKTILSRSDFFREKLLEVDASVSSPHHEGDEENIIHILDRTLLFPRSELN
jgi:hypothetical protein